MAISKNLVTLMGGTISIQSEPGEGSAFAIELEFDISGKAGKEKLQKQSALEALKVLVADDDRDSCIHAALLLETLGIHSDWVLTGKECVEKISGACREGADYDGLSGGLEDAGY